MVQEVVSEPILCSGASASSWGTRFACLLTRSTRSRAGYETQGVSAVATSTSGWDPYDVWCTRVRGVARPTVELPPNNKKECAIIAALAVIFGLVILLALVSREWVDKSKLPVHLDSHFAGCSENHLVGQCGRQRPLNVSLVGQVLAVQSVTKAARPRGKAGLAVH